MDGRERRLQSQWARLGTQSLLHEWQCLGDLLLVPAAAVLIFEKNQIACLIESGGAA